MNSKSQQKSVATSPFFDNSLPASTMDGIVINWDEIPPIQGIENQGVSQTLHQLLLSPTSSDSSVTVKASPKLHNSNKVSSPKNKTRLTTSGDAGAASNLTTSGGAGAASNLTTSGGAGAASNLINDHSAEWMDPHSPTPQQSQVKVIRPNTHLTTNNPFIGSSTALDGNLANLTSASATNNDVTYCSHLPEQQARNEPGLMDNLTPIGPAFHQEATHHSQQESDLVSQADSTVEQLLDFASPHPNEENPFQGLGPVEVQDSPSTPRRTIRSMEEAPPSVIIRQRNPEEAGPVNPNILQARNRQRNLVYRNLPPFDTWSDSERLVYRQRTLTKFHILRERYPNMGVEIPGEEISLQDLYLLYEGHLQTIYIEQYVDGWKRWMVVGWLVTEWIAVWLGLKAGGYTRAQIESMYAYDRIFLELGESYGVTAKKKSWPPLVQIIVSSVSSLAILCVINHVAGSLNENIRLTLHRTGTSLLSGGARTVPPEMNAVVNLSESLRTGGAVSNILNLGRSFLGGGGGQPTEPAEEAPVYNPDD